MTLPELSAELLPCPFCGGEAYAREYKWEAQWVACGHCHARTQRYGPTEASLRAAIAAWNTRTGQLVERDAVAGVLAELIRVSGSGSLALDREKDAACAAGMEVLTAIKGGGDADG